MDTVANMLSNIRNAQAVGKPTACIPYSRLKFEIAKILERAGFVVGVEKKTKKDKKSVKPRLFLELNLKYTEKIPAIAGFKKISKPGQRIYVSFKDIKRVKQGYGIGIVSTSKGLLTEREARRQNIGGEMLCEIW